MPYGVAVDLYPSPALHIPPIALEVEMVEEPFEIHFSIVAFWRWGHTGEVVVYCGVT